MTSSIKLEVHNVSQRRLRRIEPLPEVISANVVKTAVQFRRYARGQNEGEHKETCALKHCALPHRGRSNDRSERTKQRRRVVYNADKRAFMERTKGHSHYKCPSRTQCERGRQCFERARLKPTGACCARVRAVTRVSAVLTALDLKREAQILRAVSVENSSYSA